MRFSWAVSTDAGLRRRSNEDCYSAREDLGLFVVADGMGGHVGGEVASRIAVQTIEKFIDETADADKNRTWPFGFEPALSLDANRLKAAFRLANRQIANAMADAVDLRGMATTASALIAPADGKRACVAHVGDSRVYVMRHGVLDQITADHSWVEEQVRAGAMTRSAAREHPWRHVVTRALAGGDDPQVDVIELTPAQAERFLLCSDGLFTVVSHDQIAKILAITDVPLLTISQQLIDAANQAGGPDNITTIVLEVDPPEGGLAPSS